MTLLTKQSSTMGKEGWTAKFEIKNDRAVGKLFNDKGEIVRNFDLAISMGGFIEVPLSGTRKKIRFRTTVN